MSRTGRSVASSTTLEPCIRRKILLKNRWYGSAKQVLFICLLQEPHLMGDLWTVWDTDPETNLKSMVAIDPRLGQDRDKPIYHKCSLNISKSSVRLGGGALLNPGIIQKCGGCLLPSSHGNMEVASTFIPPFWYKFVMNCFLRTKYLKSIYSPPDLTIVTPAPFRILLNRTLDFLLAHKLWKHQK